MRDVPWFYESRGSRIGPVSEKEIRVLLKERKIEHGTLIWRPGLTDWITIETSEWKNDLIVAPPLRKDRISDLWAWLIALAPLILTLRNSEGVFIGVIILWFLNVAFCALDIRMLRRAGYCAPSIWWSGPPGLCAITIITAPIYLYLRSRRLRKLQAPLICWVLIIFMWSIVGYLLSPVE